MRLIDADKLHPDRMTKDGLAISQSQIANTSTVNAIPISVIEDIKAEIRQKQWHLEVDSANQVIEIINKHIGGKENEE